MLQVQQTRIQYSTEDCRRPKVAVWVTSTDDTREWVLSIVGKIAEGREVSGDLHKFGRYARTTSAM